MTAIARELDEKLKTLDPMTAANVERLVRDALELAGHRSHSASHLPADFFEKTSGALAGEPFERPPQGEFEKSEEW